jgi:uncharacterized lipoprotein YajG
MKSKRFSLVTLLIIVFAGGMLAGCSSKETEAEFKSETPEQKQLRQEKKGD